MVFNLGPIVETLADLGDGEPDALIATVNDCPQFARADSPGSSASAIGSRAGGQGLDFPRQPPEAAIEPSEDVVAIGGHIAAAGIAGDRQAVTALRDGVVALLTGKERRQ